jgi:high-affinity iron transporter
MAIMAPGFLITLREGLEAALIIGLTLGVLEKANRGDMRRWVWSGVIVAALLSVLAAIVLQTVGAGFEGTAEEIFEGITMLLAAGVLTWMIFWMRRQGRQQQDSLLAEVSRAMDDGQQWLLFGIAFFAVLREGIETVLFLSAAAFSSTSGETLIGAIFGLIAAIVLGWILFASTIKLDVSQFFKLSGALLLLFAAGLFAHGIHEFIEVGWIPTIIDPLYNVNHILDENSTLGSILKAIFGYNGNPSLVEALAYTGYMGAILVGMRSTSRKDEKISTFQAM